MIKPGKNEIASRGKKRPALSHLVWALLSRCSLVSCCLLARSLSNLVWTLPVVPLLPLILWLILALFYHVVTVACSATLGGAYEVSIWACTKHYWLWIWLDICTLRTYVWSYVPTIPALCLSTSVPRQKATAVGILGPKSKQWGVVGIIHVLRRNPVTWKYDVWLHLICYYPYLFQFIKLFYFHQCIKLICLCKNC